ncbi:hypothetical protein QYF36_000611 [Acer negundo]|nr:hypothetical protein QYF36_000611 [Acer negundo]
MSEGILGGVSDKVGAAVDQRRLSSDDQHTSDGNSGGKDDEDDGDDGDDGGGWDSGARVESAMESKDDFDMQDMNKSVEDYDFYSGGDNGDDTGPTYAFDSDDEFIDNDTDDSDDLASHRHVPLFV